MDADDILRSSPEPSEVASSDHSALPSSISAGGYLLLNSMIANLATPEIVWQALQRVDAIGRGDGDPGGFYRDVPAGTMYLARCPLNVDGGWAFELRFIRRTPVLSRGPGVVTRILRRHGRGADVVSDDERDSGGDVGGADGTVTDDRGIGSGGVGGADVAPDDRGGGSGSGGAGGAVAPDVCGRDRAGNVLKRRFSSGKEEGGLGTSCYSNFIFGTGQPATRGRKGLGRDGRIFPHPAP